MAKCQLCGKYKEKKYQILEHIEECHSDDIPDGWTTAQYYYSLNHGGRDHGLCRECGKPTPWNEESGKPSQLCGDQKCKDICRQRASANMIKTYGKETLLDDPEYQRDVMLANRKITGTYEWSDHKHRFAYTGTYELALLKFLDNVLNLNPDGIVMPGIILPYEHEGKTKHWITDAYLADFNLVIEVKDGGDAKNTHPGFAYNREIEAAKDNMMRNQDKYNYIKITNKNMLPLIKILAEIRKYQLTGESINNKKPNFVVINEAVSDIQKYEHTKYSNTFYVLLYGPKNMIGIHEGAAISFTADLECLYMMKDNELKCTSKNDPYIKNKSGVLLRFNGNADKVLLENYLGHEYEIDRNIVPDSFHMIREVLLEAGYELTPAPIVTVTDFLSNDDFTVMCKMSKISRYNYYRIAKEIMHETTIHESLEILQNISLQSLNESASKKKFVKYSLTPTEMQEVKDIFGENLQCSFAKNENGEYFAYTYRARTPYYKTIKEIPKSKVRFVESTS